MKGRLTAIIALVGAFAIALATLSACAQNEQASGLRISCVGDSITYGFGLEGSPDEVWVTRLPEFLGDGCQATNYGVCGACVLSGRSLTWAKSEVAGEFWQADEDIVVLMLGTNDATALTWDAERFEREYEELVTRIQDKPCHPRVYVVVPPRAFIDHPLPTTPDDMILEGEVVPIILRVAERAGVEVIDLRTPTTDHPEWFDDGLHPNATANEVMAQVVAKAIADGEARP